MLRAIHRVLPDNKTQVPEPSTTSNASLSTITSLGLQQGSQWGPSGIGTVVFGCVASVLGILALWMMFWLRQKEAGHAIRSDEGVGLRIDATASDDDVALGYLPHEGDVDLEVVDGYQEDAVADIEA